MSALPPIDMELICARTIAALDANSLECNEAKEALFRSGNRFVLYLSDGRQAPSRRERLIVIGPREALLWLNENQEEAGSFWE
jgi:hypothetical protein